MARYRKNPRLTPEERYAAFGYAAAIEEIKAFRMYMIHEIYEYFRNLMFTKSPYPRRPQNTPAGKYPKYQRPASPYAGLVPSENKAAFSKMKDDWVAELDEPLECALRYYNYIHEHHIKDKELKAFSAKIFGCLDDMYAIEDAFNEFKRGQGVW